MSLTSFIETWCGHQEWLFEDMREEVLNLLRDLAATVHVAPTPDAESLIQLRFNNEEISNAIIYYFRLLASAWLKANAVIYRDFIPDGLEVDNYSKNTTEPAKTEIEHLGMTVLIDVLLKPVGIAVEIVYLDQSKGTDVNSHIIQAKDESGTPIYAGAPVVHLLYRPGHYDILYKERPHALSLRQQQIIDGASASANIQVNSAGVLNGVQDPSPITNFNSFNLSGIAGRRGLSMAPLSNYSFTPAYTSLSGCKPIMSPSYSLDTLVSTLTMQSVSPISAVPSQASSTLIFPPAALPIHGGPSQSQLTRAAPPTPTEAPPPNLGSQFRHSKYEYESDWNDPLAQQSSFHTNTFKNSHYNTAHYNNPNFQPEEWCPDDEERPHAPRRDSTRHKSAST